MLRKGTSYETKLYIEWCKVRPDVDEFVDPWEWLNVKEKEGFLTVSEIGRRSRIHKWTVSRTIDLYMHSFLEVVQPVELEAIGLQAKLVRLKDPNMTSAHVINYLKFRRKLNT